MEDTKYVEIVALVKSAVSSHGETEGRWKALAFPVAEFFGSEAKMLEVKAQFCADAIVPALNADIQCALARELPRKGTDAAKEFEGLDAAIAAKKNARATVHVMFARVVSYAFPKARETAAPRSLKTRFAEEITALIKAGEKAEDAEFDIVAVLEHLRDALAKVTQ